MNIKKINGNEIIDYLNSVDFSDSEELCDISCQNPYIFDKQEIRGNEYRLTFSAYYNNWGTDQLIDGNVIKITKDNVWFSLDEPFEGDGSDEALEELLKKWLETHKFSTDNDKKFNCLILESNELLNKCLYGDIDIVEDVIKKLITAKSLIK